MDLVGPTRVKDLLAPARFYPTFLASFVLAWLAVTQAKADALTEQQWQNMRLALDEGAQHATYWQYGWGAFHTAVLAASSYRASEADDPDDRYDARVSAVTSALGLIDLILNPLPHRGAQRAVERLASDASNPEALIEARQHFRRAAQEEVDRRAWRHSTNAFLVNLAAGLVIGIGDDRPKDGAVQFASGMLVTGLKVWTLPNQASFGWHEAEPLRVSIQDVPVTLNYAFHFSPTKVGVELRF